MEKRLTNIGFDLDEKYYELGFGLDEVREFANYSIAKRGNVNNLDLIKFALKKNSDAGFITDKRVEEINEALSNGIEVDGEVLNYDEIAGYLIGLFIQAIDDAAREVEPATLLIEKDSTSNITVDGEKYKLMFTRDIVNEAFENNSFDFNNLLELYVSGSTMIKVALQHYKKRLSVKLHDKIFLSLWATKFTPETEADLPELINALNFHMKEVIESGIKKSKTVIKAKTR